MIDLSGVCLDSSSLYTEIEKQASSQHPVLIEWVRTLLSAASPESRRLAPKHVHTPQSESDAPLDFDEQSSERVLKFWQPAGGTFAGAGLALWRNGCAELTAAECWEGRPMHVIASSDMLPDCVRGALGSEFKVATTHDIVVAGTKPTADCPAVSMFLRSLDAVRIHFACAQPTLELKTVCSVPSSVAVIVCNTSVAAKEVAGKASRQALLHSGIIREIPAVCVSTDSADDFSRQHVGEVAKRSEQESDVKAIAKTLAREPTLDYTLPSALLHTTTAMTSTKPATYLPTTEEGPPSKQPILDDEAKPQSTGDGRVRAQGQSSRGSSGSKPRRRSGRSGGQARALTTLAKGGPPAPPSLSLSSTAKTFLGGDDSAKQAKFLEGLAFRGLPIKTDRNCFSSLVRQASRAPRVTHAGSAACSSRR